MDQQCAARRFDALRDVALQEGYDQGKSSTGRIYTEKGLLQGSEPAQESAGLGNSAASHCADAAPDPACPGSTTTLLRDRGWGHTANRNTPRIGNVPLFMLETRR